MPFEEVRQPIAGRRAFEQATDAALLSQAAILLLLGVWLRGDRDVLLARAKAAGTEERFEWIPAEETDALGLPSVPAISAEGLIEPMRVRDGLRRRYGEKIPGEIVGESEPTIPAEVFADLCDRLYRQPEPLAAAELMEACLRHAQELPRIAAAVAYLERSSESERLTRMLEKGTDSEDELVRDLAATGLAQIAPEHSRLIQLQSQVKGTDHGGAASHTTLLVHGTWARQQTWWQPGGDFHSYLGGLLPTLPRTPPWSTPYAADDRFEWSGGYSDDAREVAGKDLLSWVYDHNAQGLDLITHSHGGSVAMIASQAGLNIGELVLLNCPVHVHKYLPVFRPGKKIVCIRVHLDLVILADRGGQRFRNLPIEENVLPLWFDHTATHQVDVWKNADYDVPAKL